MDLEGENARLREALEHLADGIDAALNQGRIDENAVFEETRAARAALGGGPSETPTRSPDCPDCEDKDCGVVTCPSHRENRNRPRLRGMRG